MARRSEGDVSDAVRGAAIRLVLAALPFVIASESGAQGVAVTKPPVEITVSRAEQWVQFAFPKLLAGDLGCGEGVVRTRVPGSRHYEWGAMTTKRGSDDVAMAYTVRTDVWLELPGSAAPTDDAIDSAMAIVSPRLAELIGEPPGHQYVTTVRATLRRDRERTLVRFEGAQVVKVFLSRYPDRAIVWWCYRPIDSSVARLQAVPITVLAD